MWLSAPLREFYEKVRPFIPRLLSLFLYFSQWKNSSRALIPLFMPGSVHNGSCTYTGADHLFTQPFACSFTHLFIHPPIRSATYSSTFLFIHSAVHPPTCSSAHSSGKAPIRRSLIRRSPNRHFPISLCLFRRQDLGLCVSLFHTGVSWHGNPSPHAQ